MAEEIKIAEQTPTPAPKTVASPAKTTAQTKVKIVLTGAGSFSGLGLHHILKGQELTVDNATANKLLAAGLFKKA